jgi:hypothetical protein
MKNVKTVISTVVLAVITTGCTRIETGTVGVRVGFDRTIAKQELPAGSFNQTIFGDVLTFQVKDVSADIPDLTPIAKDNSTMKDFDVSVIYNINEDRVADLYISKNKSFHSENKDGDVLLMSNYMAQLAKNAVYKASREYEALEMADNRVNMESKIKDTITMALKVEGLSDAIVINQSIIKNILPADTIVASSNALVQAKNTLKQREVEVKTAEAEARRMQALSNQSETSIEFMRAQAMLNISEGIKAGKVNTIIVPSNFTGLMTPAGGNK